MTLAVDEELMDIELVIHLTESGITEVFTKPGIGSRQVEFRTLSNVCYCKTVEVAKAASFT